MYQFLEWDLRLFTMEKHSLKLTALSMGLVPARLNSVLKSMLPCERSRIILGSCEQFSFLVLRCWEQGEHSCCRSHSSWNWIYLHAGEWADLWHQLIYFKFLLWILFLKQKDFLTAVIFVLITEPFLISLCLIYFHNVVKLLSKLESKFWHTIPSRTLQNTCSLKAV